MLRSVWQKFSGKQEKPANPTLADSLRALERHEADGQYAALWALLNQRQFMEVRVEGSNLAHQTLILAIDIQRGLLWLDDIFPSPHVLETGDAVTLRHHRNDEQLSFTSPIIAWGKQYGAPGLAVALPNQASYQPRRKFRRVELLGTASLSARIRPIGYDISYGNVDDLSAGGLRMSVPGNLLAQLRHGALLPLCELRLSDELHIRCSARVRAFRLVRNHQRYTQISVEFVDLAHDRQLQLEQFVNNLYYLQNLRSTQAPE